MVDNIVEPALDVVDLSVDVAGGFCARLLLLNGARVRRPTGLGPEPPPWGTEGDLFAWRTRYLHEGKEPLVGTGEKSELLAGRPELAGALQTADVVIGSFDAGRFSDGADPAAVRALNPGVVHVTTSSFGTTGPYRHLRGSSLVDWAAGGYLYLTGDPAREPLAGPPALCAYVGGYTAAIAVYAALIDRARSGVGRLLDISTMEAMLSMHQSTFSRLGAGVLRTRTGRYTEVFPLVVLPCRDGHVSLGVVSDDEFGRLAVAMGCPELAADGRFVDAAARNLHTDELEAVLRSWLAAHGSEDVVARLRANGLASAKVASTAELLANEQLGARGFWQHLSVEGSTAAMPGNPVVGGAAGPPDPAPGSGRALAGALDGAMDRSGPGGLPLGGEPPVIVLDLTAFWAGPSATRNLADFGARVIRVERPGSRIDFSDASPAGERIQANFEHKMSRHKQSVVIDLRTEAGRSLLLDLVERADVLVENYRAGVMDSLDLGDAALRARNPRLVSVALSGFGAAGPWSSWKSYGPTIEAASSIEWRTRYRGGDEPFRLGHTLPDGVGGLAGTLAVLVGLFRRAADGQGSRFDVSQLEAYAALSGEAVLASSLGRGEGTGHARSSGVHPCRGEDQWIVAEPRTTEEAAALTALLGADGPLGQPTAERDKGELATELQARGVAAFPVLTPRDLVADAHLAERGYFERVAVGTATVTLPGSPFHAVPSMVTTAGRPPRFGEHTASVLSELLGLDHTEVARLADEGVVTCAPGRSASSPDPP
jgi:crotonobetainyl-CoA:carnitine CoA-transferase CaiB-like acyl-CoA transferase